MATRHHAKAGAGEQCSKTIGAISVVKAGRGWAPACDGLAAEAAAGTETFDRMNAFVGAGVYDRFIPAVVQHLAHRVETVTSYTPYQPEASQGTLRSIFEFQSMMAALCGMDVANASLYDGASSLAEAALMAHAVTERNAIVLSKGVNPLYRQVVETYCEGPGIRLRSASIGDGATDLDALAHEQEQTEVRCNFCGSVTTLRLSLV